MTSVTPEGDLLDLAYEGTWVFEGNLAGEPPESVAAIHLRYRIAGGDGVFDGAFGRGRMPIAGGVYRDGVVNGSLRVNEWSSPDRPE